MPLIYPWRTAYGADPVIESVLVKFTSGANEAWGEACTLGAPTYSPEHAAGIFCVLKEHFVDLIVGKEFGTSEDLQDALRWFKGNQFAKVRCRFLACRLSSGITYAGWCARLHWTRHGGGSVASNKAVPFKICLPRLRAYRWLMLPGSAATQQRQGALLSSSVSLLRLCYFLAKGVQARRHRLIIIHKCAQSPRTV